MALIDDVRDLFERMWHDGYDGKDLAIAFIQVGVNVIQNEEPDTNASTQVLHQIDKDLTETENQTNLLMFEEYEAKVNL